MELVDWLDYALLIIYLPIIYLIAKTIRNRLYPPNHPWRKYFMPSLFLKIFGSIFITFLYVYYYGAGDTIGFYRNILRTNQILNDSVWKWINVVLQIPKPYEAGYTEYISAISTYQYGGNGIVVSIGSVIGIFACNSIVIISVLFAVLSFTGIWALFRIFAAQYPLMSDKIALSVLYFPSVIAWGSGLFKDTICMFALGWLTYFTFQLLIKKKTNLISIIGLLSSTLLIGYTKIYILAALIPALLFWVLSTYAFNAKNPIKRFFLKSAVPVIVIGLSIGLAGYFSEDLGLYSIENIAKTSTSLRNDILEDSKTSDGSGYDLGDISTNPVDIIYAMPKAVNVTLFRPYLWESRKIVILLSSLESTALLLIVLFILFKIGIGRTIKVIQANPNIQFCLIFTIIFAFAVGISTYNFGSLSRYKIPCLPFFGIALALIYEKGIALKESMRTSHIRNKH